MIFDSVKEIRRLRKELFEANKKISYQLQRIIDLEDDNKALEGVVDSQNKEIERLEKGSLKEAMIFNSNTIANIRAEAVKKFAKTLKEHYSDFIGDCYYQDDFNEYLDNLVKKWGEG